MKIILLFLIQVYQRILSPVIGKNRCRFFPSCSEYARQALILKGLKKGLVLIIKRLIKCGPWHPGGIDTVPNLSLEETLYFDDQNNLTK